MILQIVGYKNSGKTTLVEHSVKLLKAQGYRVVTVKHHGHEGDDISLEQGVDHMKHFEAGADQSIVQGHQVQQTVTRTDNTDLEAIIANSITIAYDIVIVEGFKKASYDKVILYNNNDSYYNLSQLSHVVYELNTESQLSFKDYDAWLLDWVKG
ncbi:molybdopterin-guanine dinucleotide biosynthesis protein B [Staphylococcus massiliensis]|uniref:Molybdopterin-guanine dinucleotide biosynthesis protein B n=1 Tax=Staphylococcus massiliensis S46 TaxID=1229783 RepID=K9B2E8_9STAP|nr:molybdopterin-guanine dinucleotide biosynthesis protein B [Staphylococcus massiliensis]EKU48947.1 molybdopterin-guanine dinucleotide biosynthesis protein B [Staphylococcus massiliensis S46]MCG3399387.1 molybdopterin-guanine dinucleotide biosynthesis protein B [Staphylococcus massiliensis]MCG3402512.1 molybdopterin-guanine dinucleotide biosynthesis protein B [Staphylococcus massiliensis]MCG3411523.1 molybdopterin-guanine dinucleotide biosynthesis protein B [Staphylococcus massiliensis]PNZ987